MARPLPRDSLSLTAGGAALVTDAIGSIEVGAVAGLFVDDVRVVSSWAVRPSLPVSLAGRQRLGATGDRLLFTIGSAVSIDPAGTFERLRSLTSRAFAEELRITAYADAVTCSLRLEAARDDRPVYDVGDDRDPAPELDTIAAHGAAGRFTIPGPVGGVAVTLDAPGWHLDDGHLGIDVTVDAGATWTGSIRVTVSDDEPAVSTGQSGGEASSFSVSTSPGELAALVETGLGDLRALAIPVGGRLILGAGSPFFLALFGRDSMIAGMQALVDTSERLTDILSVLAVHQATSTDELTRAEPGRILHELRLGRAGVFGVPPGTPYYGAVDTSALFVVALGEAWRWGVPDDDIAALMPVADAALEWCRQYGDVDCDGFIESVPHASGLTNLGWKDSGDSMVDEAGRTYVGTVALAEVQGYHYRALRTMAELEQHLGLGDGGERLAAADELAARFARAFCYDRDGKPFVGLALDADKRLLAVAASNAGHVLWSGILPPATAAAVAEQLAAPDLFSGWGVRTLSSGAAGYNPFGYHRGAVWPHDTALALHGAARYGVVDTIRALAAGLVDLGAAVGGQLPELLSGLGRTDVGLPVPYAAACRPQAWAAGAPLVVLRAGLGLEPDVPAGVVRVNPSLPADHEIAVHGMRLGEHEISLTVRGDEVVDADTSGLELVTGPTAILANTGWCPR